MALVSITNGTILNSETSDVTKLTQNDNDLLNGITDGTKDIQVLSVKTDTISEKTGGSGVTIDGALIKDNSAKLGGAESFQLYSYSHTIDATDAARNYAIVTIDSFTLTKVIGLWAVGYDASLSRVSSLSTSDGTEGLNTRIGVDSVTSVRVALGTDYVANDTIRVVVMVVL